MTPQQLHDAWLIITVIATLSISGIAIYLWKMFRNSSRKWFFWSLAAVLASIAVEHVCSEIKNLGQPAPADFNIALMWVIGRAQEAIVAALVLGYVVFGRNGKTDTVTTIAPENSPGEERNQWYGREFCPHPDQPCIDGCSFCGAALTINEHNHTLQQRNPDRYECVCFNC